jgi:hypothetical protein
MKGVVYKSPGSAIAHMQWTYPDGTVYPKCPTVLAYEINTLNNQYDRLVACGVQCLEYSPQSSSAVNLNLKYVEWFKLLLDRDYLRPLMLENLPWAPVSKDEVVRWNLDYLTYLYDQIRQNLTSSLPDTWNSSKIHFRFSYTACWSSDTVARFKECVKKSGFGSGKGNRVEVDITEAEASALYVLDQTPRIKDKDTVLIMDVGGGTCDVVAFKAHAVPSHGSFTLGTLELMQKPVGYTDAEKEWENYLKQSLAKLSALSLLEEESPGLVRQMAIKVRRSRWFRDHVQSTYRWPKGSLHISCDELLKATIGSFHDATIESTLAIDK